MTKLFVVLIAILMVSSVVSAVRIRWTPQGFMVSHDNGWTLTGALPKEGQCFRARAPCGPDYHVVMRGRGGAFCCPGAAEDESMTYRTRQRTR